MGMFLKVSPKELAHGLIEDGPSRIIRQRLSFAMFSAAATTVNLDVQLADPWTKFPGGIIIKGAWFVCVENWTGGSVSAATLSAGTTASATAYIAAGSVFSGTNPRAIVGATQVPGTYLGLAATPLASGTVRVQLVTTTANANALTAGKTDFFMELQATSARSS